MKPRIKIIKTGRFQKLWKCSDDDAMGLGVTPLTAFRNWEHNARLWRCISAK